MELVPLGPNLTELHMGEAVILFSYRTPVAARVGGRYYRTRQKYSVTTSRHINRWLGGARAEVVDQSFITGLACRYEMEV